MAGTRIRFDAMWSLRALALRGFRHGDFGPKRAEGLQWSLLQPLILRDPNEHPAELLAVAQ